MEHLYIVFWVGMDGDVNCSHIGRDRSIAEMAQKVEASKHPKINFQFGVVMQPEESAVERGSQQDDCGNDVQPIVATDGQLGVGA
jgi:hypothetical protein